MAQSEQAQRSGPGQPGRSTHRQLASRVRLEYHELPGLSLTADQAARLFSLDPDVCRCIFDELVEDGVLVRKWEGQYVARRQGRRTRL